MQILYMDTYESRQLMLLARVHAQAVIADGLLSSEASQEYKLTMYCQLFPMI